MSFPLNNTIDITNTNFHETIQQKLTLFAKMC